jgi:hypothetical protein
MEKTTCHDFEARLEALSSSVAGAVLPAEERAACLRHAAGCPECSELLELARMGVLAEEEAGAPAESLVGAVLASTSGPACDRALLRLAAVADGGAPDPLAALHLETCPSCRALAGAMAALAVDLPRLAEVRPDAAFADDVLRATLPVAVRLRRWWRRTAAPALLGTWERLVRRPRFAWEAAFVVTVAFLPLIVASGPTLAAAPARGAEEVARLAQEARSVDLESQLGSTVREIQGSEAGRRTEDGFESAGAFFQDLGSSLARGAGDAAEGVAVGYGTLRDLAASFLTTEGEDGSSPATNPTREKDTAPAPHGPASEETTR